MAEYPARWEADVVLADGGTVHVRPIRPDDAAGLQSLHSRLSPETVYLRFFSPMPRLSDEMVERFTTPDYVDRLALVAELGEQLIAVARYDRRPPGRDAEVAFVVDDAHQGRGLGTILLEHLAVVARENGIERFTAETLPHNRKMLDVFRSAGFGDERHFGDGVVEVAFRIQETADSLAAVERRDHVASRRSVERLLAPRSIAVVGASREPGSIGNEIFRNVLAGGFTGPVYPVHPSAHHVASVRAYASVVDVPDDIDLAVIVVPAAAALGVVDDCAAKHVRALVVVTSGFSDAGEAGADAERVLVERARRNGMRLLGPNCMGLANTAPAVSMNATITGVSPPHGRIALASQSGALGVGILEAAADLGLGISTFVSMGNKADVSGNDLLEYWEDDPDTHVVLLYLESFGNPRRFARVARRISRRKPIVAVKGGRAAPLTDRDQRSRTAALASPDAAVNALFRQTGMIRVDTLEHLFDVARLLVAQPLPAGPHVGIVGHAGGPAAFAAGACEGAGLVPRPPVELALETSPDEFERAISRELADDGVDALIAIFTPAVTERTAEFGAAIALAAAGSGKPVVANVLRGEGTTGDVPTFRWPETAALALARAAEYADWLRRPEGDVPTLDGIDPAAARLVVDTALAESPDGVWLDPVTACSLVAAYGIPVLPTVHVSSVDEAILVADDLGWPVALKAGAGDIVHKRDAGAIALDVATADELRAVWAAIEERVGPRMGGGAVQPMAPAGVDMLAGVVQHESFGPLVMFGTGGPAADLLADLEFRILPLTDADAAGLVRSVRGAPLLFGLHGAAPADVPALEDLLLRVGRLVDDLPEVAEMDLSPVVAAPSGAVAADVRVRVAPFVPRPEHLLRRLR